MLLRRFATYAVVRRRAARSAPLGSLYDGRTMLLRRLATYAVVRRRAARSVPLGSLYDGRTVC